MEAHCLRILDHGGLETSSLDAFVARTPGEPGWWIDLEGPMGPEVDAILSRVSLHAVIRDICLYTEAESRVLPLPGETLLRIPILVSPDSREVSYVTFMCLEDVLITLRAGPCECFSTFLDYLGQDVRLYSPSPSALLASMLSGQSVDNVRLAMGARVEVQRLADALDADPGAVDIERILAVKRSIRELDALADEQRYAFGVLRGVAEQTFGSSQPLLEIAFGNAEYMARTVDRLDDRLSDLHDHRVLSLQDETNRRINVLTLISAIFLPLTLIAGIYGMNFEQMPELREPLAYPITLGLMGALAASLVLYFRHRGWFD